MKSKLMSAKQTAEFLNMSLTWIYRDARKCGLVGYKLGNGKNSKLQFKSDEVARWLEQQKFR
ncbi:helix-turn-helix domain-containing protein [Streptomyces sp. NPDC050732]|uniref:helix-turn-helix domain-containing protein n=1 Tax=Streptomyces sp. NPDC050732 TaxID=3154632 RepID=UPI00341DD0BD